MSIFSHYIGIQSKTLGLWYTNHCNFDHTHKEMVIITSYLQNHDLNINLKMRKNKSNINTQQPS